jgi:hypothetical protein
MIFVSLVRIRMRPDWGAGAVFWAVRDAAAACPIVTTRMTRRETSGWDIFFIEEIIDDSTVSETSTSESSSE